MDFAEKPTTVVIERFRVERLGDGMASIDRRALIEVFEHLDDALDLEDPGASGIAAEYIVLLDVLPSSRSGLIDMAAIAADDPLDARELWTPAVETLGQLPDDDLVLARAVRTRDYRRLYAVATLARRGLDEAMAMTDPDLHQRLSRAIVLKNLKGYGGLDIDKLRTLIEEGSQPKGA